MYSMYLCALDLCELTHMLICVFTYVTSTVSTLTIHEGTQYISNTDLILELLSE